MLHTETAVRLQRRTDDPGRSARIDLAWAIFAGEVGLALIASKWEEITHILRVIVS